MITVRGHDPSSNVGVEFYASDSEWMALHGFVLEANDQESAGLTLYCFAARGDSFNEQAVCDTLAAAMTAHKDFAGTLGRVTRNGSDVECPTDLDARKLRNRQLSTVYEALITQAKLEAFIAFLSACGGFVVLG
jgi:hypothetical protein